MSAPAATTLDDLRGLAVIDVWHEDRPNLAGLLAVSRSAAYDAVRRGEFPAITLGRRVVVKVPALLVLLGVPELLSVTQPVTPSPLAHLRDHDHRVVEHDQRDSALARPSS